MFQLFQYFIVKVGVSYLNETFLIHWLTVITHLENGFNNFFYFDMNHK